MKQEFFLLFPFNDGEYTVIELLQKKGFHRNEVYVEVQNSSGETKSLSVPFSGEILEWLIEEKQAVRYGEKLAHYRVTEFQVVSNGWEEDIWNLAIATNAAFKGLLAYYGNSGQIAQYTIPVKVELDTSEGYDALLQQIIHHLSREKLEDGDVVVIADKPFAVAQRRLVSYDLIHYHDPKKMDKQARINLVKTIEHLVDTSVDDIDLILADTYRDPEHGLLSTLGAFNHNRIAADVAELLYKKNHKKVDVVISDTDTGIDVREKLIGTITLGATPLGATKGLSIYETMRAACAAEFTRGSKLRIPIVICKPIYRSRNRDHIGEFRGYEGKLNVLNEKQIAFA